MFVLRFEPHCSVPWIVLRAASGTICQCQQAEDDDDEDEE
jgi:hypothetical protein